MEGGVGRQHTYLGVTVQCGVNRGFRSMGDRMKEANGLIGMIKYARMEGYSGEYTYIWVRSTSMVSITVCRSGRKAE